ncbi:MAG: DNA polymerase III subunit delta [Vicinamibacterales bacterium]
MPALTAAALREQITSGHAGPLYVLMGADDMEKSAMAGEFADMVDEGLRAFNVDRLYGGEMNVDDLVQTVATLPMMAPRRVVVVLNAERLLIPKRESKASEEEMERLEAFLGAPPDHATVVFVCGDLDMRRRVVKLLVKQAQVVTCGVIEDAADAEHWVRAHAAKEGVSLDAAAVSALAERAGRDVVRLRSGLERVRLYAMGQAIITAHDVRAAVPAGPESQENFGIANAIGRSDAATALRELGLALEAGAVPVMIMGQIRWAAEQLPSARLHAAMDAVLRTDLALKSSGGDPRILIERLVVELCGAGVSRQRPTPGARQWSRK